MSPGYHRCRRYAYFVSLFLLIAPVGAGGVSAQEIGGALTLDDVLSLTRRHNPAYRRALTRVRSSGAEVRAGIGAFLPSLSGSVNFNGNSQTTFSGTDDFGRPVDLTDGRTFNSSSTSQSLSSSITLFDGFQNINNLRASRFREDAAQLGADFELTRVRAEVTRRFYDAIRTQRAVAVEEELLASAQEQLDATQRLFRVGSASQVDVLGARVDVSRQELAVERAKGDARQSLLQLRQQMGMDDGDFSVAGDFPESFDPSSLDVNALVTRALRSNASVAQARADESASRSSLSAARGLRLPTISARASFSRNANLQGYDAFFDLGPRNRSWGFGVSVEVPIFSRFGTSRQIAQADANHLSAQESLRESVQSTDQQVRSALIDLENAHQGLLLENRSLELSREQLSLAQEQYRLGALGFQQLQQVVDRASQAERQALTAEYQFAAAVATLEERLGGRVFE